MLKYIKIYIYSAYTYLFKPKENYRLYECVGRGGFGEVYRARSLLTGQESAIKLVGLNDKQTNSETDIQYKTTNRCCTFILLNKSKIF